MIAVIAKLNVTEGKEAEFETAMKTAYLNKIRAIA